MNPKQFLLLLGNLGIGSSELQATAIHHAIETKVVLKSSRQCGRLWRQRGARATPPRFRDPKSYYFDGKPLIDAHEKTYTGGKIGLWTKADSVIAFDDLTVSAQ